MLVAPGAAVILARIICQCRRITAEVRDQGHARLQSYGLVTKGTGRFYTDDFASDVTFARDDEHKQAHTNAHMCNLINTERGGGGSPSYYDIIRVEVQALHVDRRWRSQVASSPGGKTLWLSGDDEEETVTGLGTRTRTRRRSGRERGCRRELKGG